MEKLPGYAAMDVAPNSVGFAQALIVNHCVAEIHILHIDVELKEGVSFPLSEIKSRWKQVSVEKPVSDAGVLYYVFRENE